MWCAAPARADYRPQLLRATSDRARRVESLSTLSVGVNIIPLGGIFVNTDFCTVRYGDRTGRLRRPRRLGRPRARLPPRLAAAAPALPSGVRSAAPRHRLGARSGGLGSRGACRRFVKTGCTIPAPLPSSSLQAPHRLPWQSLARSPARAGLRPRQLAAAVKPPLTKSRFCPIGCANCRQNRTFCIIGTVDSSVSPCGNESRICIERRI